MILDDSISSILNYWETLNPRFSDQELEKAILPLKNFGQLSQLTEGYKAFLNTRSKSTLIAFGESDYLLGIPTYIFHNDPIRILVSKLSSSAQQDLHFLLNELGRHLHQKQLAPSAMQEITLGGVEIWSSHLVKKKLLIRLRSLMKDADHTPALALLSIWDVSHLMRPAACWGKFVVKQGADTQLLFSREGKSFEKNIFTTRESAIMQQFMKQKSNEYIARKFEISLHTVWQHQKNMIAKTGTINRTSLISLAQIADIA
ncbi:helix-turn-helix transcriptional regulator [Arundinibacter roseus]|uniref:LuxR family transcriptional regulator n=1 Tax=Arundinibacter roseus TaxID=2070510 RepID=A0A4R4KLF2_9BACT|nr:helix-turn-helix transcriptional regulator [Arundinibacter roseus]TDB69197.1 LuxR family transcriptional regulator [Arundinibacter roseus]